MKNQVEEHFATIEAPKNNCALVKAAMDKATKKGTLAGLKHMDIQTVINGMKSQIAQALPTHVSADRVIQMAVTLVSRNPAIAECTAQSLIGALMQASILGFEPVSALGQCYFIPRSNKRNVNGIEQYVKEVEFQIGYKGYIKLAQNSGNVKTIYANVVREGDDYKETWGLYQNIHHVPNKYRTGREKITNAYAVAHYINGGYNCIPLTINEIENFRQMSAMPNGFGWKNNYEAMCKKTAIRRLATWMPQCTDIQKAIISDGAIINQDAFTNNKTGIDLDRLEYIKEEEKSSIDAGSGEWLKDFEGGKRNA